MRKFTARKKTIITTKSTTETNSEVDFTKTVIFNTLIYFIGRIGSLLYRVIPLISSDTTLGYFKPVQYMSSGCSYLFNIFIYYYFNKAFKRNFWRLCGRLPVLGKMFTSPSSTFLALKRTKENQSNNSHQNQTIESRVATKVV